MGKAVEALLQRKDDTPYKVGDKIYTQEEMVAVHKQWQDMIDYAIVCDAVDVALEKIDTYFHGTHFREFAHNNDPEVMNECLNNLNKIRKEQDEYLTRNNMGLGDLLVSVLGKKYLDLQDRKDEEL